MVMTSPMFDDRGSRRNFRILAKMAPLLNGHNDRGKVVVGEHHVGGLLRDVSCGDPHGDLHVGGLERGSIV